MEKNSKLFAIVAYITWIGWIISFLARDKNDAFVRHHVNQALILNIVGIVINLIARIGGIIGTICGVISLACLVLVIMGIVRAAKLSTDPLPLVGGIELIH